MGLACFTVTCGRQVLPGRQAFAGRIASMIQVGEYRYQITFHGEIVAYELAWVSSGRVLSRREAVGTKDFYQVEAQLDPQGNIIEAQASSLSGLFTRSARYRVVNDVVEGSVRGVSAITPLEIGLGRFREIDFDMAVFKALVISHLEQRGAEQWTGRVATVDPVTLVMRLVKHSYSRIGRAERIWRFEPAIGEIELIELDSEGRLVRREDEKGFKLKLLEARSGATHS